jgi:hypothetical protein
LARSYRYRFGGAAATLVTRVRQLAEANGVGFEGDDEAGRIEGRGVKATYDVSGDVATVTVHRIPFIISWGMVESQLDSAARSWGATRLT